MSQISTFQVAILLSWNILAGLRPHLRELTILDFDPMMDGSDLAIYQNGSWDIITTAYGYKGIESTPPNPGNRTLTAGVAYPIRIRFHEQGGEEALAVDYYFSSGSWASISFSLFSCNGTTPITTSTILQNNFPNPAVA